MIKDLRDLEPEISQSSKSGEMFAHQYMLSKALGMEHLSVSIEVLPPGHRSSSPHCHTLKEEMVYVLKGHPQIRNGDRIDGLKPGDFFGFKPGLKAFHCVENMTEKEVVLLVVSDPHAKGDEVLYQAQAAKRETVETSAH